MNIKSAFVLLQYPDTFTLKVIELALKQSPGKDADDAQHQQYRERDQQIQHVHQAIVAPSVLNHSSRLALAMTSSELSAMPSPAAQGGSQPTRANGMHTPL